MEENKDNRDVATMLVIGLIILAITTSIVLLFFPGVLTTMWIVNISDLESRFWKWIIIVAVSLFVFMLCGFNPKRYLILDAIIVAICIILALCIEEFMPIKWGLFHMFGIDIDWHI